MIHIQQILCPVDLPSSHALDYGVALARWYRATMTVLHVFSPPALLARAFPQHTGAFLHEEGRNELLAQLNRAVESASADGIDSRVMVAEGNIVHEIETSARTLAADLIVMGSRGPEGSSRLALGSVAERVLRISPCPVLTVPPTSVNQAVPQATFKHILCAVDFSPESMAAIPYALSLAQEAGGELILLHVIEWFPEDKLRMYAPQNLSEYRRELEVQAREKLMAAIPADARDWCRPFEITAFGNAGREVLRWAEEWHSDVIVIGVRGRGTANLLLFGSTANAILREAPCPVLTIRGDAQ